MDIWVRPRVGIEVSDAVKANIRDAHGQNHFILFLILFLKHKMALITPLHIHK